MRELFVNVLNVSVSGSVVIGVVVLLRLVLKRVPKKYICLLWLLVGLRLLMPFEIESHLSLQPDMGPLTESQWEKIENFGHILQPGEIVDAGVPVMPEEAAREETVQQLPLSDIAVEISYVPNWPMLLPYLWLAGIGVMGLYAAVSYLRLRCQVKDSVIWSEGVWICRKLDSAFVLGVFRPQVYLSAGLSEEERKLVLAHERNHIRRGDHIWKLLGFGALTVHWFNPLVWTAYVLLCRDIEMACDEAVVKNMDAAQRKAYSAALLASSARGYSIAACPVAFGEVSVKQRIRNVLIYRKPGFWVSLIAVIAIAVVIVFFMTSPADWTEDEILAKLYAEIDALQSREEYYIRMEMDIDCEYPHFTGQTQEFWMLPNGDWYRNFTQETIHGEITTVYMQCEDVQYACEYGDYVEGFRNRGWQEIPKTSYAPLPPILTKDFTELQVLEILRDDDGFSVVLQNDWISEDSREKVYEYTYTFRLDQKGTLTGIVTYSDIYSYVGCFDFDGYTRAQTDTEITLLAPNRETCSRLIAAAMDEMK